MTLPQGLAFAVILGMMALFVWGRLRYDLVAMLALFMAVIVGIVPVEEAFTGFSDDIIIIVGSALVVSAAVARSGLVERILRQPGPYLTSPRMVIIVLVSAVTTASMTPKSSELLSASVGSSSIPPSRSLPCATTCSSVAGSPSISSVSPA